MAFTRSPRFVGLCAAAMGALVAAGAAAVSTCPGDLDGSGAVDASDLASLLAAWGEAGGPADLDGNGAVDGGDLASLLGAWGDCPPAACPEPWWSPDFRSPNFGPYPNGSVVHDDGTGRALFVGGMGSVGGVALPAKIARWHGDRWSAVPGVLDGSLSELHVHDFGTDGTGPALYASGDFDAIDGVPMNNIARWDGTAWSPLGAGLGGSSQSVFAMASFDDGRGGTALYAAGSFTTAGGAPASRIARWDGMAWSPLGAGVNGTVYALHVHDDGTGPALYVGGQFTTAGGQPAANVARWNGKAWSTLGSGASGFVRSFATVGPEIPSAEGLVMGGSFTTAGGVAAASVARWTGSAWTPLGAGVGASAQALAVFDDGDGPRLYAGGTFLNGRIRRWTGSAWELPPGGGANGSVNRLTPFALDGGRPSLFVGGTFTVAGGLSVTYGAMIDAEGWSAFGQGVNGQIFAALAVDDIRGQGPSIFVTGSFTHAGGVPTANIARWDGRRWHPLGSGLGGGIGGALELFDPGDGSGPALIVGGRFTTAGGQTARRIARWDGATWSALGTGVEGSSGEVVSLAAFDPGDGPRLFVSGVIPSVGGIPTGGVAIWDGSAWAADAFTGGFARMRALPDPASGVPTLYGIGCNGFLARDAKGWRVISYDFNGCVRAIERIETAAGPRIALGGGFSQVAGVATRGVAQWDGTGFAPLGGDFTGFSATVWDFARVADGPDGPGSRLFAVGSFRFVSGVAATNVAAWDGTAWRAVEAGIGVAGDTSDIVYAVRPVPAGMSGTPGLFFGGSFGTAGGQPARSAAIRGCGP